MQDAVAKRLKEAGADVGDVVRVDGDGFSGEGRLMPRHAFSAPDCVILKLGNGYNVGVRVGKKTKIAKVRQAEQRKPETPTPPASTGKERVAVLGTGGTIASYVDYRTGAVHPAATADELAFATPEIFDVADVEAEVVFQVFSEDLTPKDWRTLAEQAAAAFEGGARGVVIPHGTDTLGYTGAALSFLLQDLPGPVVLVGAQRSSDRPSSDAAANLTAAVRVAATADLGEVVATMHASGSDDRIAVHRGTRVRKNHTSRRDAFESVNAPPLGVVKDDVIRLDGLHRARATDGPTLAAGWEEDVGFLWSYPGMDGDAVAASAGKGLVLAGTGLGHVPRRCLDAIETASKRGTLIAMASQCLWGRTNLRVYSTGRDLLARGVVEAGDMLPETTWVKLQYALGVADDAEQAARILRTDVAGELRERTQFEASEEETA